MCVDGHSKWVDGKVHAECKDRMGRKMDMGE